MDKETILARSRQEHKDKDLYKAEVESKAGNVGMLTATAVATVFFIVQILVGKGLNYGLYAILFSVGAGQLTLKAIRLKGRKNIVLAALYTVVALALAAVHIYGLVAG